MQIMLMNINEVDGKCWISHCSKWNEIQRSDKLGLEAVVFWHMEPGSVVMGEGVMIFISAHYS